jgi:hypothetical protein
MVKLGHMCNARVMETKDNPGYYPEEDEYDLLGAAHALGKPGAPVSRKTVDRRIPPGTPGRRLTGAPGVPEVRIAARLVKALLPTPGGGPSE